MSSPISCWGPTAAGTHTRLSGKSTLNGWRFPSQPCLISLCCWECQKLLPLISGFRGVYPITLRWVHPFHGESRQAHCSMSSASLVCGSATLSSTPWWVAIARPGRWEHDMEHVGTTRWRRRKERRSGEFATQCWAIRHCYPWLRWWELPCLGLASSIYFNITEWNHHRWLYFSRMRSKGSRFTLGVWGLRVCSLDVAQPFATVRRFFFGGFKRRVASFRVAGVALRDIQTCFGTCRKSFCVAGAILLPRFHQMWQALHSTLHTPPITLHTPHFTFHTLHSKLHTLHSTLHTLHSTLYTPHFTLYTLHSTL